MKIAKVTLQTVNKHKFSDAPPPAKTAAAKLYHDELIVRRVCVRWTRRRPAATSDL